MAATTSATRYDEAVKSVDVASLFPTKRTVAQDTALLFDCLVIARRNGEQARETMSTFGKFVKRNGFTDAILGASVDAAKLVPLIEVTDSKTGAFKSYTVDYAVLNLENSFLAFLLKTGTQGDNLATAFTVTSVKLAQSIIRRLADNSDFRSTVEKSEDAKGQTLESLVMELESHLENVCRFLLLSDKIRPIQMGAKECIANATTRRNKIEVAKSYSEDDESATVGEENIAA